MKWRLPKTRKMRIVFVTGTFAGLYGLAAVSTHFYVRAFLLPQIHAASSELSRFEPRILADLKSLQENPIYPELPRATNAERFLSGFISWRGVDTTTLNTSEHDRLISMMKIHERAFNSDEAWSNLLDDDQLKAMDLSWVDQLIAYDHIDFGSHPAYAYLLDHVEHSHGIARVGIAASLPLPELRELRFAALARFAQRQLDNNQFDAPELFRHIGYLLSTTDTLIGSMLAVDMLQTEKRLAERTDTSWAMIDDNRIQALKRTAWAWGGITRLRAREQSLGSFEPYFHRSTNACAGLVEMFGMGNLLQDYLKPTAPLEYDLHDRLALETQFMRRLLAVCDHKNLGVFLSPIASEDSPVMIGRLVVNPARVPFLRRILGLKLLAFAPPNYFGSYNETPREPASK